MQFIIEGITIQTSAMFDAAVLYVFRESKRHAAIFVGRAQRLNDLAGWMENLGASDNGVRAIRFGVISKEEKVG